MVSYRDLGAAGTLVVPFLIVLASRVVWGTSLPSELPRQWDAAGVSATMPSTVAFAVIALICLLAGVLGLSSLRGMPYLRRRIFLGAGAVAGIACALWLVAAGQAAAGSTDLGGWGLVAILAGAYGFIPFFLSAPSDVDEYAP